MNYLNDLLFSYVQSKKTYLKESTYARYSNLIENHIKESIGKKEINLLTNKDFQFFCDEELLKGTSIIVIKEIMEYSDGSLLSIILNYQ